MDEKSPWYEPDAPDSLKNGVRSVYVALDRGLAEILERIDPDTHVFVVLTRGMRSHVGGWQLLPEILVRLGYTGAGAVTGSVRSRLPAPVRKTIKSVVRGPLRHRLKSAAGTSQYPLENSADEGDERALRGQRWRSGSMFTAGSRSARSNLGTSTTRPAPSSPASSKRCATPSRTSLSYARSGAPTPCSASATIRTSQI